MLYITPARGGDLRRALRGEILHTHCWILMFWSFQSVNGTLSWEWGAGGQIGRCWRPLNIPRLVWHLQGGGARLKYETLQLNTLGGVFVSRGHDWTGGLVISDQQWLD